MGMSSIRKVEEAIIEDLQKNDKKAFIVSFVKSRMVANSLTLFL